MTARTPTAAAREPRDAMLDELQRIADLLDGRGGGVVASSVPGLDLIARRLELSPFERDILMLVAATELDGGLAEAVAQLQGGSRQPTFAVGLSVLPAPHWDALSPERPLRRARLLRLGAGETLAARPLRIDEPVLHRISGLGPSTLDGLVRGEESVVALTPSQAAVAAEIARAVQAVDSAVLVRLDGADADTRAAIVVHVARALGGGVMRLRDGLVDGHDLADIAAVIDREALLDERLVSTDHARLISTLRSAVVVTEAAVDAPGRVTIARTAALPTPTEQVALWTDATGSYEAAEELAYHFRLSARTIAAVGAEWRARPGAGLDDLQRLSRERARVGFGPLAERIDVRATWEDLVLPKGQIELLRDIERQVRHRALVYDRWGMADRTSRGLGVTAMFAGESGTGKTLAAEVLAASLGLDLYRIDLAAVVSKYIGETEKHIGSVFDAAETAGAVLLFDEADALFGKRSEVRDSHDRYANLEVAYLLQRMEAYRGLAILTTNLRANVDHAFLRRIRFVVQFPFPDAAARIDLWRRALPSTVPQDGVDVEDLAPMQLSGGAIRSIALSAAFAAADAGTPVTSVHLLRSARLEAAKAERALTNAETAALRAKERR